MKMLINKKGMVLPTVIIVGAILIMAGIAVLASGILEARSNRFIENKTQAHFIARSAAEALGKKLMDGDLQVDNGDVFTGQIDGYDYEIVVGISGNKISLNAEGISNDVEDKATLVLDEYVGPSNTIYIEAALFANGTIHVSGSAEVVGGVGTALPEATSPIIIKKPESVHGGVYYEMDFDTPSPELPPKPVNTTTTDLIVDSAQPQPLNTANAIVYYDDLVVSENGTLTIRKGSSDSNSIIVVNNLVVKVQGNRTGRILIDVPAGESVQLYVLNSIEIDGSVNQAAVLDHTKLEIYYYGTASNMSFDGSLSAYFHCGNIDFSALVNKTNFTGIIVSSYDNSDDGYIKMNGNTLGYNNLIYAPNTNIDINGAITYTGSIIAKKIIVSGNFEIEYEAVAGQNKFELPSVVIPGVSSYEFSNWQ